MKTQTDMIINKYIAFYHKRNFVLSLICAIICFIPLFIVSLIANVIKEDILISFVPFAIFFIVVGIESLFTIRFKRMIFEQEKEYEVQFNDDEVIHLETTLFISNEWLIWAGSVALCKKNIKTIKSKLRYGRAGSSNEVIITTLDDRKYRIWCLSSSNVDKIKKWKNTSC